MSTKYLIERDVSGTSNGTGFGMPFCEDGQAGLLAQNVAQSITVPSNYPNWLAVITISPTSNVYVNGLGTAAVPGGSFAASTTEIIPSIGIGRFVKKGQALSFITPDSGGAHVTVKFYPSGYYQN